MTKLTQEQIDSYKAMDLDTLTAKKIETMRELKELNTQVKSHELYNLAKKLSHLRQQIVDAEAHLQKVISVDVDKIQEAAAILGEYTYNY